VPDVVEALPSETFNPGISLDNIRFCGHQTPVFLALEFTVPQTAVAHQKDGYQRCNCNYQRSVVDYVFFGGLLVWLERGVLNSVRLRVGRLQSNGAEADHEIIGIVNAVVLFQELVA
jgi:hypothetical protein